jgi:hypothetical protein
VHQLGQRATVRCERLPFASPPAALSVAAVTAGAEVTQKGILRVSFEGRISPHRLPRTGAAPVTVSLAGNIKTVDGSSPPQLRTISLAINRRGRLDYRGLPVCRYDQIDPASSGEAIDACRASLVGTGTFEANVALPEQSPFPSNGRVLAFNGLRHGRPVIFAHIFGTEPLPQSFVLPFAIERTEGAFRTVLVAHLPRVAANWGFVSGISLTLARRFRFRGTTHSYLSAGCPAPMGFPGAVFAFARASFGFEDGKSLSSTLTRSCEVSSQVGRPT